ALFGQGCTTEGSIKTTYGTGCFLLMNTGEKPVSSENGLITTIASKIGDKVNYALEGSIFTGGSLIQWIRDSLRFIQDAKDTDYFAANTEGNGGVFIVPAFTGLGAPYWDMNARGSIFGLTRGTTRNHIIRASLEAIAYQTYDILSVMEEDSGMEIKELKVDGGASANNFLMQFQSDICDVVIKRPSIVESTSMGAFFLAALKKGWLKSQEEIPGILELDKTFVSSMDPQHREKLLKKWHRAVERSLGWED
ncbi:MAG: FGGY-family carbohydrate kinase, partial [Clostridiaceae bacterium]